MQTCPPYTALYPVSVRKAENLPPASFRFQRDAARYAAGTLELEELIPDASSYPVSDKDFCREVKTISVREFRAMERKVNLLEELVNELLQASRIRIENKEVPEASRTDFINQSEAAKICRMPQRNSSRLVQCVVYKICSTRLWYFLVLYTNTTCLKQFIHKFF